MSKKISDAYEGLKLDYHAKQRVYNKVTAMPERKRKRRIIPAMASLAAVLALIVGAYSFLPTQVVSSNSFTVRVYAVGQQADGTIAQREIDLANQAYMWGGVHDGTNMYLGISLDVLGENIESVEFSIANGFFAKQYYEAGRSAPDGGRMPRVEVADGDGNLRLAVFGTEFEALGQRISHNDIRADNLLLFVAVPGELSNTPEYVDILVHVVFADGERQTETVALKFGERTGLFIAYVGPDFVVPESPDWSSINLNDLTLIPESVTVLTPYDDVQNLFDGAQMYILEFENCPVIFFESRLTFEETDVNIHGMTRKGTRLDVILTVVKLVDGDLVGMEYIVPPAIASEFGF